MKVNIITEMANYRGRVFLTLSLLLSVTASVTAAIIPADRLPSTQPLAWQGLAGVPGGIPNRTTIFVNVLTTANTKYKAVGDGSTDDLAAIQNAINDCPANQVVYLPAARYFISNRIRVTNKGNWTLRGDGQQRTIISGGGSSAMFAIGGIPWGASWGSATPMTGGFNRGSTNITVSSTANIQLGQLMVMEQLNDGITTFGFGSGSANADDRLHDNTHVVNTIAMVTAINGNQVTFWPPLNFGFDASLSPQACGYASQGGPSFVGIEDMTINGCSAQYGYGLNVQGSYGCWIKDVELTNWGGLVSAWWTFSSCCEIRDCYIHEPSIFGWSTGYPMQFDMADNFLVQNNMFYKFQAGFMVQGGSSGNVFAYNAFFREYDVYPSGVQDMLGSMYGNHTPYPQMNLWEGNYGNEFHADYYYGPSGKAVLLRNYITGSDVDITETRIVVNLDSHSWSNSVVGNILGSSGTHAPLHAVIPNLTFTWANSSPVTWTYDSGTANFSYGTSMIYRLGYPYSGNNSSGGTANPPTSGQLSYIDTFAKANTLIHGNWDYATKTIVWDPSIADHTIPNSMYLPSKPAWFGNLTWPPYNPASPGSADITSIPAGYRFVYGTNPPAGGPPNLPPVVAAAASPRTGSTPLTVVFSSAGSSDPEGATLTYNWSFGDGSSSTAANPSHTYSTVGTYSAQLSVSDGVNISTSPGISITVTVVGGNAPPTASAHATPSSGTVPFPVSFSSAGSADPEGATLTYTWTFGDGSVSTAANPSHTYQSAGTFAAQLTVSDGTNTSAPSVVNIQSKPVPPANLHVGP